MPVRRGRIDDGVEGELGLLLTTRRGDAGELGEWMRETAGEGDMAGDGRVCGFATRLVPGVAVQGARDEELTLGDERTGVIDEPADGPTRRAGGLGELDGEPYGETGRARGVAGSDESAFILYMASMML